MQKQEGKVEEELDSEKEPKKEKYSALENQEINTEYLENKISKQNRR